MIPQLAAGPPLRHAPRGGTLPALAVLVALFLLGAALPARAVLPAPVARAFTATGVPLDAVAVLVEEVGRDKPLFAYGVDRSMNPASVMKLVTTFAALELLGPDHRFRTQAYLGGPLTDGVLAGDLILRGGGDPKITLEQWQAFIAELRARGLARVSGDLVLDRSLFRLPQHDPAAFDGDPLRPYNVGPDALLLNFKAVRFAFAAEAGADAATVRVEPALPQIALGTAPRVAGGDCGDWRGALRADFVDRGSSAQAGFSGSYAPRCGERDWYVALLDPSTYALGLFTTYFRAAGGQFDGGVRNGAAPSQAAPFVELASPPLADIVRDVNKLSNNVMARQLFLALGLAGQSPPATLDKSVSRVRQWLRERRLRLPGLVLENGSGLSRNERITARGLANLLAAADASPVRGAFIDSLAIAAVDGTVERRFQNGGVVGQAQLKTGTLEGVRALAGYVTNVAGRRYIVVAMVNHPGAARTQPALDALVQWVHLYAGMR